MSADAIRRRRVAAACTLLAIVLCAGCLGPSQGRLARCGHADSCSCGQACAEPPYCDGSTPTPINRRLPCGTCAGIADHGLPCGASGCYDIPPPGRFHPVPTQPVFSGSFEPFY